MRYPKQADGQWIRPVRNGYKVACCDCNLVHKIDFKIIRYGNGRKIVFRVRRDNLATAAKRRIVESKNRVKP